MCSRLLNRKKGASDRWLSELSARQLVVAWLDCMPFRKCSAWDAFLIATLVTTWQLHALCGAYLFSYKGVELWHYSTGFILDNCVRKTGALLLQQMLSPRMAERRAGYLASSKRTWE